MTTRSTLADTVMIGSTDTGSLKHKLVVALLAIVGVTILLRLRGDDTQASETEERSTKETEDESTDTETATDESTTSEPTTSDEGTIGSVAGGQRELDMFDMLAIFAAAITSARDEYRKRTGS